MIGIIVQARLGSTRLPHKTTRPIEGSTVVGHVLQRCSRAGMKVILACPEFDKEEFTPIAHMFGVDIFGGQKNRLYNLELDYYYNDVLDRYYSAAKKFGLDHIVRITGDCPMCDPEIINQVANVLLNNPQYDYVSNVGERTYPKGLDVEAFTFEALAWANKHATLSWDREHVTPFIVEAQSMAKANIRCPVPFLGEKRWVIDFPGDLEFARKIWPLLPDDFGWRDILKVLSDHPEIQNPREEKAA